MPDLDPHWLGRARLAWRTAQRVRPPEVERALASLLETPHPLAAGPVDSDGPGDVEGLRHVVRS